MKKRFLILAAVAVSGVAAVVASNTNAFVSNDAESRACEFIRDAFHKYLCDGTNESQCKFSSFRGDTPVECTGVYRRLW